MSQDGKVEGHVRYEAFKRTNKIFLTPTDKLEELKTQLNKYFVHLGGNQSACHVGLYKYHAYRQMDYCLSS